MPKGSFSSKNGCVIVSFFRSCHFLKKGFPSAVGQQDGAAFAEVKAIGLHDAFIDQCQHKTIREARSQLLHQIQRQRLSACAVPMQISYVGIQTGTLQRRRAVMRKQAVGKGKQSIERVQRRSAAAPTEKERLLFPKDHIIQHAEVCRRTGSFQSAQALHRGLLRDLRKQPLKLSGNGRKPLVVDPQRMISSGAFHAPTSIIDLPENHTSGNPAAARRVVGLPILHPAQKDVSLCSARDTRKKSSPRRTKCHTDAPFDTRAHQGGRRSGVGKGNDALQHMQRVARNNIPALSFSGIPASSR